MLRVNFVKKFKFQHYFLVPKKQNHFSKKKTHLFNFFLRHNNFDDLFLKNNNFLIKFFKVYFNC